MRTWPLPAASGVCALLPSAQASASRCPVATRRRPQLRSASVCRREGDGSVYDIYILVCDHDSQKRKIFYLPS